MVNFQDPAIGALDFLAVVKLWHTVGGLYIWEFVTTLDYEWSVFRGRRPYLRTIWLYSMTRVALLIFVILGMVNFDATRPINCQAWVISATVFGYMAVACATLLLAIRTIAIWNKNKIVVVIAMGMWLVDVAFQIRSVVQYRAFWLPVQRTCAMPNAAEASKANIVTSLATDIILLLIMLFGLYRRRRHGGTSGLARILWKQGLAWFLLATIAEVPPTVFIFLNLNGIFILPTLLVTLLINLTQFGFNSPDPFNIMFQAPAAVTVCISATRMYRSLTNICSSNISQSGPPSRVVPGTNGSSAGPIPLKRMEVAVHTHSEQYTQASQYGLYDNKDGQLSQYDKPHGLGIDGDVESGGSAGEK